MEVILLIWLPLCIAVAILANRYNRNGFGWFCLSLLLSPLIGFAFVLALGPHRPATAGYQPSTGHAAPDNPPNQGSAGIKHDLVHGSRFFPPSRVLYR